jgi:methylenetetrahydrofolate dehydrogenase (NADP+)/methenyltetrahydrofolate cyclohydrolase
MMDTSIFCGHGLAAEVHGRTRKLIARLGRAPRCVVLTASDSAPMLAYAARQREAAQELGIDLSIEHYDAEPPSVLARLAQLGADTNVDAVMTLYPLPHGVQPLDAALSIGRDKDVDGLHPWTAGLLSLGAVTRAPATARACLLVVRHLLPSVKGAEIVVVGASRIVGRPLATMLLDEEATVTVCHVATRDLAAHTSRADVVITAAGVPGLITASHIKEGAVLIDVSVVRSAGGLIGDVDIASVAGKASVVTHVPDGVGPITTACLFENVALAALQR